MIACKWTFAIAMVCTLAQASDPGNWTKCNGRKIEKCLSCVTEISVDILKIVLKSVGTAGVPDVAGILKTINAAPQCISICANASTKNVERECSTQHCKTDFCVACC